MKRIFQIALTLALALALMLPVAAIINVDGSDPEWDGYAGIRPAMDDILVIGEPTDDSPLYGIEIDDYYDGTWERNPLARDGDVDTIDAPELEGSGINAISDYLDIDPISAEVGHSVPVALFYVGLGVAVLALVLAIIALVKKK
ncbi:MAG: hypothetical protein FWE40_07565 [Oscillospiraceae bacterium]|jgi:hypothetical protein|nr:hypothetical protein [Oscillospiraceae bacterium]